MYLSSTWHVPGWGPRLAVPAVACMGWGACTMVIRSYADHFRIEVKYVCPLYVIYCISPSGVHIVVCECRLINGVMVQHMEFEWCVHFIWGGGGCTFVVDHVYLSFTMLHILSKTWSI